MPLAARNIQQFLQSRIFTNLTADVLLQSGMKRRFEILGGAYSPVSVDTQRLWPSIDWQGTENFCNLIVHEYFRIDLTKRWQVPQRIVPGLQLVF